MIGGSDLLLRHHCFQGQMGAIYMFADCIADDAVRAIHALGPGYRCGVAQSTFAPLFFFIVVNRNNFQDDNEVSNDVHLNHRKVFHLVRRNQSGINSISQIAFSGKLTAAMMFNYNAKACEVKPRIQMSRLLIVLSESKLH